MQPRAWAAMQNAPTRPAASKQGAKLLLARMGLCSLPHRVLLTCLAVVVQSFMLLQCSLLYVRLLWRHRGELHARRADGNDADVPSADAKISCIVMVRNEEAKIRAVLRCLASTVAHPGCFEVVVVDSGCTDNTMTAAQAEAAQHTASFATLVTTASAPGRGAALDAGSAVASGEIIFVLHADCVVPPSWDTMIRQGLGQPGVLATAFRFQLNQEELQAGGQGLPGGGVMEYTVHLRATALQLPFGDQGLALRTKVLASFGGWGGAAYPLLEDFQLVQKLRVAGAQGRGRIVEIGTVEHTLRCSPRRWLRLGIWRINLVNQLVMLWYQHGGGTPQQLFDFYYGIRTDHVPGWLAVLTAPLMPKGHGAAAAKENKKKGA